MGQFDYNRRKSHVVRVASVMIGGKNPIRLQSMTNTSTLDTHGSVAQIREIADVGGEIVRLTAQGVREAANLSDIKNECGKEGVMVPLVADIHFNPKAAFEAALHVDKVRINPGNFVDPGRMFKKIQYTEEEYLEQLKRLKEGVEPFYRLCKEKGVAVRIGVNHGSLSDRIMSRYGDTPDGMVESAMEFLRIARDMDFNQIVVSIKSSNTTIMVETVRKLVIAMENEGMEFPLHLGVTEAGDGEDGRIKSAIGIGTLLAEGIGDTIRVSLSENPANEIPVAKELVNYIVQRSSAPKISDETFEGFQLKRETNETGIIGGSNPPIVIVKGEPSYFDETQKPDFYDTDDFIEINTQQGIQELLEIAAKNPRKPLLLSSHHRNPIGDIKFAVYKLEQAKLMNPVIARLQYSSDPEPWKVSVRAAADFGALLIDDLIQGIMIETQSLTPKENARLAFGILQGTRKRITKTEYIACPGCGRTLFNLSPTLERVREATQHLKGLKIGVMGCIVNGPGEMADADYGYVGAAAGKVSLYRGKELLEKNIPEEEAVSHLIKILKADNKWKDI